MLERLSGFWNGHLAQRYSYGPRLLAVLSSVCPDTPDAFRSLPDTLRCLGQFTAFSGNCMVPRYTMDLGRI